MKTRVYLDNCCLNRLFDDQSDMSVRNETEAVTRVRRQIYSGEIELAWSFVLEYEISKNPYKKRKDAIVLWKDFSAVDIKPDEEVYRRGKRIEKHGLRGMDALHVACAMTAQCDCFLTTDRKILNKEIKGIELLNPVEYIRRSGGGK